MTPQTAKAKPDRHRKVNPSRVQLSRQMRRFARETGQGALVLDAGAGRGPYSKLFKHARYEAADFAQFAERHTPLDYVCDITSIPVEDARFDAIVCNQVLEHLPDPSAALCELRRVLKPGGRILLSAPLFYHEHQKPYDFFRYTRFGLRRLFDDAGFDVDSIEWLEGYFGTIAYMFRQIGAHLPSDPKLIRSMTGGGWRGTANAAVVMGTKFAASHASDFYARLDGRWKYTSTGMPKNYLVLARRPEDPE